MSLPQPQAWHPPAPSDHPKGCPWPPNIPSAGQLEPPKGHKGSEPYCGSLARNAFGPDYFQSLRDSQPDFQGNWWLLATLLRFEEAVRGDHRADRFAWWNECIAQLRSSSCHIDFRSAHLHHIDLSHIYLQGGSFNDADVKDVVLHDADLSNSHWTDARFCEARGVRAIFEKATLNKCIFRECNYPNGRFQRTMLASAEFHTCKLLRCSFRRATLMGATLSDTSLRGSRFHIASIKHLNLSKTNLSNAKGLFGPNRAIAESYSIQEHHIEDARFYRPWKIRKGALGLADRAVDNLERHAANWERLRTIGQLRLFGVSYLAVIAITSYTLLARWHNTRVVSSARAAAERARQTGEDDMWATLLGSLPQLPTPAHLGYQLAATALLAAAATIYALRCPNEVREATEVGWTRRMGQPLWEYRSAKWSRAGARYLCLVLFLAGGSYTLWYLLRRSGAAVWYLLQGL